MWLRGMLAACLLTFGITVALGASDMTGRYKTSGTTEAQTDYVDLTHTGGTLTGIVTGADSGRLTGEAFGDDSIRGKIDFANGSSATYTGTFDVQGIHMTLVGATATAEVLLVPVSAAAPPTNQPQPILDTTPYYYLDAGAQKGPVMKHELDQLLQTKVLAPETLVWTQGMTEWLPAKSRPEFAAALQAAQYYVVEGGLQIGPMTLNDLVARVMGGETGADELVWKAGLADWVRADSLPELRDVFAPVQRPTQNPGPPPVPGQEPTPMADTTITLPDMRGELTPEQGKKITMALGAVLGIMFHEIGHALIGEIGVPATGPEEDTVDEASALLLGSLVADSKDSDNRAYWRAIATYSTLLWRFMADDMARQNQTVAWYDEHSDPQNRFRNTLCLIFGAAPEDFIELANTVELPADTRGRCMEDYPKRWKAWRTITAPFRRQLPGDDDIPGLLAADAPGADITVTFKDSQNPTGQMLLPVFRDSGIFVELGKVFQQAFAWPRPFTIVFEDCGVINAYYEPQGARLRMCWEGVEFFIGTVLDAEKVPRH